MSSPWFTENQPSVPSQNGFNGPRYAIYIHHNYRKSMPDHGLSAKHCTKHERSRTTARKETRSM